MARVTCNVCRVPCIWCKGGKCKCGFNEAQATMSNSIMSKFNIDFAIPWIVDYYKQTILGAKVTWNNEEDIINMMKAYYQKANIEITELPEIKPIITNTRRWRCEYPEWTTWAWDKCIHCHVPRFYWKNKECGSQSEHSTT